MFFLAVIIVVTSVLITELLQSIQLGSAYFFSFFFDENEIGRARIYFFFSYVFFLLFRHSQPCQIIQGGFITVAAIESGIKIKEIH